MMIVSAVGDGVLVDQRADNRREASIRCLVQWSFSLHKAIRRLVFQLQLRKLAYSFVRSIDLGSCFDQSLDNLETTSGACLKT
jgi:hypothetical protein